MQKRFLSPRLRVVACFALILVCLSAVAAGPAQSAPNDLPRIWLQDNRRLPVTYTGTAAARASGVLEGIASPQPVAMAQGDFDQDGINDLVVGFGSGGSGFIAIHRGNLDAFAPQSGASFQAIGRGEFPSPFLPEAQTFAVPISPDFIAAGNFTGLGNTDLAVAARGGSVLYVFAGDGKGNFAPGQTISLPGGVTALAAGEFGSIYRSTLIVGVSSRQQSFLAVYGLGQQGLTPLAAVPLSGPASNILFGNFDDSSQDVAFLSNGKVQILRPNLQLATVSLPVSVRAFALGSFVYDRNGGSQIALLGADGSVQIAARNEFDPRVYTNEEFGAIRHAYLSHQPLPAFVPAHSFPANGWRIVESFPAVAKVTPGQPPVFFRTRISVNGADDIMWLSAANGQMVVISHPDSQAGAQTFLPGQVAVKAYNGTPVAALPMRINVDGRFGVMALHQGEIAPSMSMPIPDPTFTVNTTNDGVFPGACAAATANQCTLREALLEANGDTVMVPAGTYTLTIAKVANDCTGKFGALSAEHTVTIVGAVDGGGNPTSIVQAGTIAYNAGTPNGVDMVMNVNEDLATANCPTTNATATVSNLVLQNGHNRGTHAFDGDGGCMEFDTGALGASSLSLTNVIIQNCDTTQGGGGGLVTFASITPSGGGTVTISNSIFQNNSAVDSVAGTEGGGIAISAGSLATISNTQVKNNISNHVVSGQAGLGGGIALDASGGTPGHLGSLTLHSSTVSGNTAGGLGGGISDAAMSLTVDSGTIISGNSAGVANQVNSLDGGGVYLNTSASGCPGSCPNTVSFNKVTITGNTATGKGGAIHTGNASPFPSAGPMSIAFSRLAGNTASGGGSNLSNSGTTVTATNNWWGTNAAATTISTVNSGVTTFDPFIVLTHNATNAVIRINQSSTLTGDMSNDNHGNAVGLANLTEIIGLPITFAQDALGTIPQAQPEALNASAQATATYNAGNTSGRGKPTATVDQGTVTANSNLIASATEASTTVTITTVGKHNFAAGQTVVIAGVGVGGYNGTFAITGTPTATTFTYTTTAGLGASSGGSATVGIIILEPLQVTKSFNPTTVAINASSTLTFSVTNPNVIAVDASFTDTFPVSLVVANPPGATNTCGGTFAPAAGDTSLSFSNASLAVGSCTITVNVSSATDNVYSNSVTINSTAAGTGVQSTSSANLTVINPPHMVKAFGATTIPLNGTTSLTLTIDSNSNQNLTLNGVAFTDNLPPGLVVATPGNPSTTCSGGTATAADGSSTVSLSGASVAPTTSCTVTVTVQGTTAGPKSNSAQVTSTNGGTGNTTTANLTVVAPPTISKAFNPSGSIPLNGITTLTFTINNPNLTAAGDLTGVAFSDTLPSATGTLVVAPTPNVVNNCNGTVTATAGTGVISLSGGTVAHNASCTLSVDVKGTTAGDASNTTGAITSTEGGTGTTSNTALLKIVAPPPISKAFGAATIGLNGTTTLTFTITNPAANTTAETGIAFSDTLTGGLQVASTPGVSNTCNGTVTATANTTTISLSGGSIATPGNTCTVVVNVTGTQSGNVSNTTGAVSSTNGGTGATSNTANLIVAGPPTISKAFGAPTIPLGMPVSLTFTINNPNTGLGLTGLAFTDNLPAGLVVASPNGLANTCNGSVTAVAGSGAVSLSGGTVGANTSCTVLVNVTGIAAGIQTNTTGNVTSTEGGQGNTASASITVVAPPFITKAFGAANIDINTTTSLTFTITNPNASQALSGVAFSDTLPAPGLTVADSTTPVCGGTLTTTNATGAIALSGASIAASNQCQFQVTITGAQDGVWTNITGAVTSLEGGTGNTATAVLGVGPQPTFTKAFAPTSIPLDGTTHSTLTFTIHNGTTTTPLTNLQFTDSLPTGLRIATADNLTGDCLAATPGPAVSTGGTVTLDKVSVPNTITLTNTPSALSLTNTNGGSCTISVDVIGFAAGTQNNTTGQISSTEGGNGPTASASIDVVAPPSIAKVFNPNTIPLNATTSLTFTITNPGPGANNVALTGVAFTDTLPTGLTVANGSSSTCGGTLTTTAPTVIALSGATIAINSQCQFSVTVTGAASGQYTNTSGAVTSTNGGTGNTATANLTVVAPPTISKAFGASTIPLNGTTSLSFTVTNPNTFSSLSGVAFSDALPSGLVVATTPNVTGSCGSGTITATGGSGSISLSGGTLTASPAVGSSCTFSVDVTGTTAGVKLNTTGAISSTEGGTGTTSNAASLTVLAPPTISKAFNPAVSIPLNGITTLTFTINNPNTTAAGDLTGVAFSDTLPSATGTLVVAPTPNGSNTCGGTFNPVAGAGSVSLSSGAVAHNSSCTVSVDVKGTTAGDASNTTGAITSTEGGTGTTSNTAPMTVVAPPSIAKALNPTTIALNGTTTLTFTITNPAANTVAENGVAFSDTLPVGLVVATPNGLSNTCGGTATATAGSTSISLTGGSIAVNTSCTVAVNITGTAPGQYTNTSGAVTSTNGGTGNTATANLTVAAPPTSTKQFTLHQIPLNGTTTVTITITNPNTGVGLTGIAFTDSLPAGLQVAPTPNASNTCGGTFNPVAGAGSATLSGGALAASASCTVTVDVQGTTASVKINSVTVSSTEGGAGTPSSDSITVVAPPVIIKAFGAASIAPNANPGTSLTFTIQNGNATVALSGVGFTDNLPAGLVVSTPNGLAGNTCSTTPTAVAGSNSISLAGATLAANTSCTFAVNVTGTTPGTKNNTTGNVTSVEGGTGGTASASVNVLTAPVIAKGFNPTGIPVNGTSTMTITITNPAANNVGLAGVAVTDNLPAGLVVATPNGLGNTCGGTATATAGSGSVALTGGSVATNSSCTLTVNVTASVTGLYTNITGAVTSTNAGTGNTATATLAVAAPPIISKSFSADKVAQNGTIFATFTITNPNSDPNPNLTLTGVGFSDTLPAGMVVATPNGVSNNCGGTVTAVPGSSSISLSGGAIDPAVPPMLPGRRRATSPRLGPSSNAAGLCVVNVNLLVTGTGTLANTTGPVSATESGSGNPSNTVAVDVVQPPTAAKAFGAASVPLNGSTSLTFTFTNPNSGTTLVSTALNDNLPSGLVVANPNGVAGSCLGGGAVVVANPGASSIAISFVTLPAAGSCVVSVNVTGTSAGTKNNTSGQVSAEFDDGTGTFVPVTGGTASASMDVVAPPSIAKAFNPVLIAPTTTSTLTFTIANPAANAVAEAGVAFTDTLPANLVVATPNGASGTCNGGTLTAVAGSGSISLTGGSIPAASNCVVSVNVTSSVPGTYTNTTGAVSSTNGGTGNTASANLTVTRAALSITKTHTDPFSRGQTGATYTITVSDTATAGPTVGTVTVVDTLPNVPNTLVATAMTGTGWTCNVGTLTCTRSDSLAPGASYPAITLTVSVPTNIQANVTNSATVSGGGDPNSHTANDPTHIGPPIQITVANGTATVSAGQSANFSLTVDSSPGLGAVSFSCSGLPVGTLCSFNPPSESQLTAAVNMNIATSGASASSSPMFPGGPTYALLFPALGLVGILFAGKKSARNKKLRLRLAMALSGFVLLLALAGCGGRPHFNGTPPGTYTITVTGTSGTTSGSATVTLNVQ